MIILYVIKRSESIRWALLVGEGGGGLSALITENIAQAGRGVNSYVGNALLETPIRKSP